MIPLKIVCLFNKEICLYEKSNKIPPAMKKRMVIIHIGVKPSRAPWVAINPPPQTIAMTTKIILAYIRFIPSTPLNNTLKILTFSKEKATYLLDK